jgi:hypothetical protein
MINASISSTAMDAAQELLPVKGQCNQQRKRNKDKLNPPAKPETDQLRAQKQRKTPETAASDAKSKENKKKCKNSSQQQVPPDQFKTV